MSTRGVAAKPRPGIVIHADHLIRADRPLLVCPLTSDIVGAPLLRVDIEPSIANGLRVPSQVMLDRLSSVLPREIGIVIGEVEDEDILRIDLGLTNILGLGRVVATGLRLGTSS
ncbi:hypothetical protein ASG43_13015 [Aureimonas sp. Leaf454]|nr:hypothetical protein ASG43_13015 [Aureimonas sp. Leaf454]